MVVHHWGRLIVALVLKASRASGFFFVFFEQTKLKTRKTGLHEDLHFFTIDNSDRQLA